MTITLYKIVVAANGKLSIQQSNYLTFQKSFLQGKFGRQRYGEAFYDHFSLYRLRDQSKVGNLFAKDGEIAKAAILALFDIV